MLALPALLLPLLALTTNAQSGSFSGTGNIHVVPGSNITAADPSSAVGCLTSTGRFTSSFSSCGTFTFSGTTGDPLFSTSGKCSFLDTSSEPGRQASTVWYAFKCGKGATNGQPEAWYAFPQLSHPWIWWGNLNNQYRVRGIPAAGEDVGVWPLYGAPDGVNVPVLLYWNKVN